MLKNLLNVHVDLLGEDRASKILEKVQSSSAIASEQTLTDLLSEFKQLGSRLNPIEAAESAFLKTPEIIELKSLSPAIYWILVTAWENKTKAHKKDIDKTKLADTVKSRITNAISIKTAYKAFAHATNLANPLYTYSHSKSQLRRSATPDAKSLQRQISQHVTVPTKEIYQLDYCNGAFRKVLFAACCYHGVDETPLPNLEALVDLLVGLGFPDADAEDYVSSFITLITGRFYHRNSKGATDYRHIRGSRPAR